MISCKGAIVKLQKINAKKLFIKQDLWCFLLKLGEEVEEANPNTFCSDILRLAATVWAPRTFVKTAAGMPKEAANRKQKNKNLNTNSCGWPPLPSYQFSERTTRVSHHPILFSFYEPFFKEWSSVNEQKHK